MLTTSNKKVAIMQPYFYPYIGYFQLIHAVDVYVNLDHVAFMKRSYMTRNMIKNNVPINVQVNRGTQNMACNKITVNFEHNYQEKFLKTLKSLYSKSERYDEIISTIVQPSLVKDATISSFNFEIIKKICQYLNIKTIMLDTSEGLNDGFKNETGLIKISKNLNADTYINSIGGQKLYSKQNFLNEGLQLKFISMGNIELENPYLSMLHQLFVYSKEHLAIQISNYSLI